MPNGVARPAPERRRRNSVTEYPAGHNALPNDSWMARPSSAPSTWVTV